MNIGVNANELSTTLKSGNQDIRVIFRSYGYKNPAWDGNENSLYIDINGYALIKN